VLVTSCRETPHRRQARTIRQRELSAAGRTETASVCDHINSSGLVSVTDEMLSGIPNPLAGSSFCAGVGFYGQHRTEMLLQRPVRRPALFGQPMVMRGDPRCLQQRAS
jgi:hypothetical protein